MDSPFLHKLRVALAASTLLFGSPLGALAQGGGPGGPGGGGPGGPGGPGDGPGPGPGPRGGEGRGVMPEIVAPPPDASPSLPSGAGTLGELDDLRRQSNPAIDLKLPGITGYAPAREAAPLAPQREGSVTLAAQMVADGAEISRGLVWRVFKPEGDSDGKLPLIASARGGTSTFELEPGSYLVHASFGRAGATKRITVGRTRSREALVLDAGGLKLNAGSSGGGTLDETKLRFSIFESEEDAFGERALILPDVKPNTVVGLNAGTYHVVSTYGAVNAVVRSDIRVEAGKLTEATVEHRAAQLTLKLVRDKGGEAMADTSWSVLNDGGDAVREAVGPYASMVLAEGSYTVIAKNRDRIYQQDVTVKAGADEEVEVLANEAAATAEGAD